MQAIVKNDVSKVLAHYKFWPYMKKKDFFPREQHYFGIKWKYEGNETNVELC